MYNYWAGMPDEERPIDWEGLVDDDAVLEYHLNDDWDEEDDEYEEKDEAPRDWARDNVFDGGADEATDRPSAGAPD